MNRRTFLLMLVISIAASAPAHAQNDQKPAHEQKETAASKLIEFHMALLKHGPKWVDPHTFSESSPPPIFQQHIAYVTSLLQSGKVVIAGPVQDDPELSGIYIFRAKSPEEARSWAMADPAVAAGHFTVEMHPWWSEDVMKKPSMPLKLMTAYLAFLVRGEKWTAERTPETEAIQKAHMENIGRLAATKKLVVAGPFGDDGRLRGIFVFRVGSLEEARMLADTDPAVRAGRLALVLHPWMVPEGILP